MAIAATRFARRRSAVAFLVVCITFLLVEADSRYLGTQTVYDVFIYQCYARAFWQGTAATQAAGPNLVICSAFWDSPAPRFHTLPREYPAPAVLIFSLPLLLSYGSYAASYAVLLGLLLIVAAGLIAWRGPPAAAIAFVLYTLLAGWKFALERYDLVPGLLVLLMAVCAQHRRYAAATLALAAATLLKGFPAILLPALLIAIHHDQGRWRPAYAFLFAGAVAVGLLPFALLAPDQLLAPLRYAAQRPIHSSSVAGLLLWLTGDFGAGIRTQFSYGACNVLSAHSNLLSLLSTMLLVLGLGRAAWRQWHGWDSLPQSALLVLTLLLVTNKVFSPQYVLWLLPLAAVYEGLRWRWLLAALVVNLDFEFVWLCNVEPTSLLHPLAAHNPVFGSSLLATLALLAQDATFCAIALWYLLRPPRQSAAAPPSA